MTSAPRWRAPQPSTRRETATRTTRKTKPKGAAERSRPRWTAQATAAAFSAVRSFLFIGFAVMVTLNTPKKLITKYCALGSAKFCKNTPHKAEIEQCRAAHIRRNTKTYTNNSRNQTYTKSPRHFAITQHLTPSIFQNFILKQLPFFPKEPCLQNSTLPNLNLRPLLKIKPKTYLHHNIQSPTSPHANLLSPRKPPIPQSATFYFLKIILTIKRFTKTMRVRLR